MSMIYVLGIIYVPFLTYNHAMSSSQDFNLSILAAYIRPSSSSEIVKVTFSQILFSEIKTNVYESFLKDT